MNENDPDDLLGAINGAFPEGDADDAGGAGEEGGEADGEEGADGGDAGEEGAEADGEEGAESEEGEEGEEDADEGDGEEGEPEINPATGKPVKPKKDFDPEKDPLPKGTLQRTVESFERLREVVKTERTRAEKAEAEYQRVSETHNELVDAITGAGLDAQRFNVMLSYAENFNSPVFENRQKAYQFLLKELTGLAKDLGEVPPGVHPLTGHDDLIAEVQGQKLDVKRAIEIAQQRNRAAAKQAHDTRYGEQAQRQHQDTQARAAARAALSKVGQTLMKQDGKAEYQRKSKIVLEKFQKRIMKLPPGEWAEAFKDAYALIPAAPKKVAPKKGVQPLRGKIPAGGGGAKQPKTMQEAVFSAFESQE